MAIKKQSGGVEDLNFGMGTRTQLRKGQEVVITDINGNHIPYSDTQSTNQKIAEVEVKAEAPTNSINNHKEDKNNPHEVTSEQVGAEPGLGNPSTDGYVLSSTISGFRSWIPGPSGGSGSVAWGDITGLLSQQTDLQDALNLKSDKTYVDNNKLPIADPVFTGRLEGPLIWSNRIGIGDLPATDFSWQLDGDKNLYLISSYTLEQVHKIDKDSKLLEQTNDTLRWDDNQVMVSDITQDTGAKVIENMVEITQADYDALTPEANTVYFIVG